MTLNTSKVLARTLDLLFLTNTVAVLPSSETLFCAAFMIWYKISRNKQLRQRMKKIINKIPIKKDPTKKTETAFMTSHNKLPSTFC